MAYYDLDMNSKRITNAQDPSDAQDVATKNYVDTYYMKQVKVERFTASGTFTPPAGSSYAIAHIRAGGGGAGLNGTSVGGNSSVAFASGTITATGGASHTQGNFNLGSVRAGATNSGQGGVALQSEAGYSGDLIGGDGAEIVAGGAITPSVGIAVVVGDGGTSGQGATGGSGYVWIEYY